MSETGECLYCWRFLCTPTAVLCSPRLESQQLLSQFEHLSQLPNSNISYLTDKCGCDTSPLLQCLSSQGARTYKQGLEAHLLDMCCSCRIRSNWWTAWWVTRKPRSAAAIQWVNVGSATSKVLLGVGIWNVCSFSFVEQLMYLNKRRNTTVQKKSMIKKF